MSPPTTMIAGLEAFGTDHSLLVVFGCARPTASAAGIATSAPIPVEANMPRPAMPAMPPAKAPAPAPT